MLLDEDIRALYPICWPNGMDNEAAVRAVDSYLQAHLEKFWMYRSLVTMATYLGTSRCE